MILGILWLYFVIPILHVNKTKIKNFDLFLTCIRFANICITWNHLIFIHPVPVQSYFPFLHPPPPALHFSIQFPFGFNFRRKSLLSYFSFLFFLFSRKGLILTEREKKKERDNWKKKKENGLFQMIIQCDDPIICDLFDRSGTVYPFFVTLIFRWHYFIVGNILGI